MGWARGVAHDGRDIGYAVEAECDQDGCTTQIDRGLGYLCAGEAGIDVVLDGADGPGCGRYFCGEHNVGVFEGERCVHQLDEEPA